MKPFTEQDRYEYPLTPESVVLDVGGYEGNYARLIAEKYGCRVIVLEPVLPFFEKCLATLAGVPNVEVYNIGLAGERRSDTMRIKGDSTGLFADSGAPIDVELFTLKQVLGNYCGGAVELLKLNCEGSEGEILEKAIEDGSVLRCGNIQVQPHLVMPNAEKRWPAIQRALAKTHELTWCAPWCWENWRLKS